jgi:hypothetical protein
MNPLTPPPEPPMPKLVVVAGPAARVSGGPAHNLLDANVPEALDKD